MNTKKNTSIEALRFLFMLIICVHHFGSTSMKHGYMAVEFFFILSGVMLMKSFMKPSRLGIVSYLWHRIKRLYPEYFIACLLSGVALWGIFKDAYYAHNLNQIILKFINTLLLLSGSGIYMGGFNLSLWYVVVLILGGYVIYALLCYNQRLSLSIIFPFIIICYYTYCFNVGDSIERWQVDGFLYNPLCRGLAGLALGAVVYFLYNNYGHNINKPTLNIVSCVSLVIALILLFASNYYDKYYLLLFPPIIVGALYKYSWLNKLFFSSKWSFWGGISYEMYLVHMSIKGIVISITNKCQLSHYIVLFIYIIITLLTAWLLKKIYYYFADKLCQN